MPDNRGTQCCAYGCTKRKKKVNEEDDELNRSSSEGPSDDETSIKRQFPRTFHRFPADLERRKVWIKNIHRERWTPSSTSRLCSDHFLESCFDRSGKVVKLQRDAVPTRFKLFPQHMKKKTFKSVRPPRQESER
ncbi:THAP domain-containing protein 2-like [Xenia sp. Carnegie-2017]|uniref:THAP domain-containing protein 2-like n=1 Tax=Xenia sp. Carnegie-2017 TaxID=2897299 RepID=UPI001F049257|nr:THAP domain-containing protein 2-like [Xenia sp. Carnegie-2017]